MLHLCMLYLNVILSALMCGHVLGNGIMYLSSEEGYRMMMRCAFAAIVLMDAYDMMVYMWMTYIVSRCTGECKIFQIVLFNKAGVFILVYVNNVRC